MYISHFLFHRKINKYLYSNFIEFCLIHCLMSTIIQTIERQREREQTDFIFFLLLSSYVLNKHIHNKEISKKPDINY